MRIGHTRDTRKGQLWVTSTNLPRIHSPHIKILNNTWGEPEIEHISLHNAGNQSLQVITLDGFRAVSVNFDRFPLFQVCEYKAHWNEPRSIQTLDLLPNVPFAGRKDRTAPFHLTSLIRYKFQHFTKSRDTSIHPAHVLYSSHNWKMTCAP